ncbi:MAG TPA: hypothetical protein VEZ90_00990 [Blastocatellia bacterium]|nr:hypothetical protein [Blastocatellia bacterium]
MAEPSGSQGPHRTSSVSIDHKISDGCGGRENQDGTGKVKMYKMSALARLFFNLLLTITLCLNSSTIGRAQSRSKQCVGTTHGSDSEAAKGPYGDSESVKASSGFALGLRGTSTGRNSSGDSPKLPEGFSAAWQKQFFSLFGYGPQRTSVAQDPKWCFDDPTPEDAGLWVFGDTVRALLALRWIIGPEYAGLLYLASGGKVRLRWAALLEVAEGGSRYRIG